MSIAEFNEIIERNDQTDARREHLEAIRAIVGNAYPNKFERSEITGAEDTISNVLAFEMIANIVKQLKDATPEGEKPNQELKESLNARLKDLGDARVCGRLTTTPRTMGKAAFVHLSDGVNRLQIYVRRDDVRGIYNGIEPQRRGDAEEEILPRINADERGLENDNSESVNGWDLFKLLDGGDFVGAAGFLFLTNTGELSVHVETIQFLSKALLPLPDKMHGIADPELQRRFRYADLIASSLQIEHEGLTTREVFERRAKLISGMRRYLDEHDFIEVETPMLTPKATGAAAEPFETFHKALGIPLYARIAPELYLKRLTVGGFERVYELNRNFRNEGLSHKHNPEFTMLEFYCAYMDVNGMMDFSEAMIKESVQKATGGSLQVKYDGREIDFSKFERLTMKEAVAQRWANISAAKLIDEEISGEWLEDTKNANDLCDLWQYWTHLRFTEYMKLKEEDRKLENIFEIISPKFVEKWKELRNVKTEISLSEVEVSKKIVFFFEEFAEEKLIQPTFIIDYPKSISPLSKASPENPQIAERFELFVNGMECANGFSELNDPQEQYERFVDQMKERETGNQEAMVLDEDYIRALAYGMPPAAGIGIGIDRLVMLLTDKHSIRDVILFPHMRPEKNAQEGADASVLDDGAAAQ